MDGQYTRDIDIYIYEYIYCVDIDVKNKEGWVKRVKCGERSIFVKPKWGIYNGLCAVLEYFSSHLRMRMRVRVYLLMYII